jgi:hypothetical protein
MEGNGIVFHWNDRVVACVSEPDGIVLTLSSDLSLTVEAVLVAAGRKSNTDTLNLAAAGIPAGARELIVVDDRFLTAVPHVYAAGDVIGFPRWHPQAWNRRGAPSAMPSGPSSDPSFPAFSPRRGLHHPGDGHGRRDRAMAPARKECLTSLDVVRRMPLLAAGLLAAQMAS